MAILDEIRNTIRVCINGKNTLIPRKQAVTLNDLRVEDVNASNGLTFVRLTGTFNGQEHGLDVQYDRGSSLMGREMAVEKGRADIERAVNMELYLKENPQAGIGTVALSPDVENYKRAVVANVQADAMQRVVTESIPQADRHVVFQFADALNAYRSAKMLGGLRPAAVEQAEKNLLAAYEGILKPLSELVAAQLTIVPGRGFITCPA